MRTALMIALLTATTPAVAQDLWLELAMECATLVEDDRARLACFDAIFAEGGLIAGQEPQASDQYDMTEDLPFGDEDGSVPAN